MHNHNPTLGMNIVAINLNKSSLFLLIFPRPKHLRWSEIDNANMIHDVYGVCPTSHLRLSGRRASPTAFGFLNSDRLQNLSASSRDPASPSPPDRKPCGAERRRCTRCFPLGAGEHFGESTQINARSRQRPERRRTNKALAGNALLLSAAGETGVQIRGSK